LTAAELLVQVAVDLETRRKPEALAADASHPWRLNQSMPVFNYLAGIEKAVEARFASPCSAILAQSRVRGACGFVLVGKQEV
jgi:hypothetical protein